MYCEALQWSLGLSGRWSLRQKHGLLVRNSLSHYSETMKISVVWFSWMPFHKYCSTLPIVIRIFMLYHTFVTWGSSIFDGLSDSLRPYHYSARYTHFSLEVGLGRWAFNVQLWAPLFVQQSWHYWGMWSSSCWICLVTDVLYLLPSLSLGTS
jgi:hypothetical protein